MFSLGSGLEVHDSEGVATDLGEASQQTSSAQVVESFLAAQNQAPTQQEMNPLPIGHIRGRIGESFTSEASTPLSVLPDPRVFLSSAVQSVRRGDGSQTKPITIADGFDARE